MAKIIKKGEIVDIEVVDEDAVEKLVVEKAADPPTNEMVLASIAQLTSIVTELSETVKALKTPPKPPKTEEEEEKKTEKVDETETEEKEEVVEKAEEKIDVVALIKEAVKNAVDEKIGDQPIHKRSTAIPEKPQNFDTPMNIPSTVFWKADVESILKMGGYTTKRRLN